MKRHTLLIDADDTLGRITFSSRKLIDDFISLVNPAGTAGRTSATNPDETERRISVSMATGCGVLGRSLEETYLKLADQMAQRECWRRCTNRVMDLRERRRRFLTGCQ